MSKPTEQQTVTPKPASLINNDLIYFLVALSIFIIMALSISDKALPR